MSVCRQVVSRSSPTVVAHFPKEVSVHHLSSSACPRATVMCRIAVHITTSYPVQTGPHKGIFHRSRDHDAEQRPTPHRPALDHSRHTSVLDWRRLWLAFTPRVTSREHPFFTGATRLPLQKHPAGIQLSCGWSQDRVTGPPTPTSVPIRRLSSVPPATAQRPPNDLER
jgi:hypothetical protein